MKKYLFIIALFLLNFEVKAQQRMFQITPQQMAQIKNQAIGSVENFCYYLSDLANSATKKDRKSAIKQELTALFIDSAKVAVKSVAHPDTSKRYPIKVYLDQVGGYANKYQFVTLAFDQVTIDLNPKHLRDTVIKGRPALIGKFSFIQRFRATKQDLRLAVDNEMPVLMTKHEFTTVKGDDTYKTGDIILLEKKASYSDGPPYRVLLGNIWAGEIRAYKK